MTKGRPFRSADVDAEELFASDESTSVFCERGTVGWAGDDDAADTGTDDNGNATYVKVTLAKGHPMGKPVADDGGANGHQIECRLMMPVYFIPPKGTPCLVLFPDGRSDAPGVGLCLPIAGPHPLRLPNGKAGEPIMYSPALTPDGAGGAFFRIKQDQTVVLATTDNGKTDGNTISLSLSPRNGLEILTPWGTLTFGPRGGHWVTTAGARLDLYALGGIPAPLDAANSMAKLTAAVASLNGKVATSVGQDAGAANAASLTALSVILTALGTVIAAAVDPTGIPAAAKAAFATALATQLPLIANLGKIA